MKATTLAFASLVTMALIGCGNGGSNPVSSDPSLSSGTVAKGILVIADDGRGNDDPNGDRGGLKGNRVEGTVATVNASLGNVSIMLKDGSLFTVTTNASTKIERNGFRATLSSFKDGDRGQAIFDPATRVASKVEATGI